MVSQKQEEQIQVQQQALPDESRVSSTTSAPIDSVDARPSTTPLPSGKQRGKKKTREVREIVVNVKDISPKPSYWPIALAFSVAMLLAGAIANDVIMWIGIVLVAICVIGWGLEHQ